MAWEVGLSVVTLLALTSACHAEGGSRGERWVHPLCKPLPSHKTGPFVLLNDGRLMIVEDNAVLTSNDDGRTWSEPRPIYRGPKPGIPYGGKSPTNRSPLIKTRNGVIILVYTDKSTAHISWYGTGNKEPSEDACSDVWSIRSLDDGQTWMDRQQISKGFCAICNSSVIQTRSGNVVVPVQPLLRHPGRWCQRTYVSADEGKTWRPSNLIDLGGGGNHDGAIEATLAELSSGKLLMLIRTNLDRFWAAYSDDDGRFWRRVEPSRIDASAAPGYLLRLASGRLMLAWNWLNLEGQTSHRTWGGDGLYSERASSSQRRELSIAFSEDDGATWSKPVVVARVRKSVCYPNLFERRPGEVWLTTGWRPDPALCVSLRESDFAGK